MRDSATQRLFAYLVCSLQRKSAFPHISSFAFHSLYLCKIFVSDLIWIIDGKDSFLLPTIQSEQSFLYTSITMQLHHQMLCQSNGKLYNVLLTVSNMWQQYVAADSGKGKHRYAVLCGIDTVLLLCVGDSD